MICGLTFIKNLQTLCSSINCSCSNSASRSFCCGGSCTQMDTRSKGMIMQRSTCSGQGLNFKAHKRSKEVLTDAI